MQIFLRYAIRNILEKKGRSLLIILSLVIATSVMILNLSIPNQIIEANTNKIKNLIGTSDVLVVGFDYFDLDDVKSKDNEISYVGVNQMPIIHKDKTLMIYGTNINEASEFKLVNNINLNDNEIIMSSEAASKLEYKVNDIVKLEINGEIHEFKIKSIQDNKGLLYFKTYSIIMNNETYNKVFKNETRKYLSYFIDVKDDNSVRDYSEYITDNNEKYFAEVLVDEDVIKDNNSYISLILMIIFVMSVIMIFFVVSTLNKMIIMERTPVIATFRSIGATKLKMNLLLILENTMYGLIGGLLGSGVSLLINNYCVKLLLGGETLMTNVPVQNLFIGIIFSVILEIIMSIGAIIKSNKYSIKQLMFENQSSKYELDKRNTILSVICIVVSILLYLFVSDDNILLDLLKVSLFWIGVANIIPLVMLLLSTLCTSISKKLNNGSLVIASKNLGFNKMIVQSSRLVVIAISVMLVILNVSARFNNILDSFAFQFQGYDLFIREVNKEYEFYENLDTLDEIDNVGIVFMIVGENARNNDDKLGNPPVILGMKESRPDIVELDYKIKDLKHDEVLVDQKYLDSNNWKVGDTINLKMDGYAGTHKFKIVGTVNSFYFSVQREIIVVNEEYFKENYTKIPYQVTIRAKDGIDEDKLIKRIELELKEPDAVIMTVDGFVEDQRNNINTIMYLFYVIVGIVLVLSFVSIINNQIISFMERKKELAVLNSICMSKSQLNMMLVTENILSNFMACLVGFITAIVSVLLMNSVLNGMKMFIDLSFNVVVGLEFVGFMMIVLFVTVFISIAKLKNIDIVESIKYE